MHNELQLLSKWKDICDHYKHLHEESYAYYFRLNNGLMIPIITLSTCSGSISIIFSLQESAWYFQLIAGVFGLSVGLLSGIYNFLSVPEFQEKHDIYAVNFDQLARTIDMELVLYKSSNKTYASLPEFIKIVKTNLDRLIENAPSIPEHIMKKMDIRCATKELIIGGDTEDTEPSPQTEVTEYIDKRSSTDLEASDISITFSDVSEDIKRFESHKSFNGKRRNSRLLLRDSILENV